MRTLRQAVAPPQIHFPRGASSCVSTELPPPRGCGRSQVPADLALDGSTSTAGAELAFGSEAPQPRTTRPLTNLFVFC